MEPEIPGDMSPDDITQNDRSFNDVSRVNNELINAQRLAAKQNAKLKRLNDELAKEVVERKRMASELESALVQNKELHSELQHRVKNTFNMISGLVSMSVMEAENPEAQATLKEFEGRVRSISQLYSLLYSKGSFSHVRLDEYCSEVISGMSSIAPKVTFSRVMEEITVEHKVAVPIGLILTELLTNVFKYAYPVKKSGRVEVFLKSKDGMACLEVRDDGVGIPEGFDPATQSGMGLKLIQGLASQIGGEWSMTRLDHGTSSKIEIPIPKDALRSH
jgi:two-component sensor histidine kinase